MAGMEQESNSCKKAERKLTFDSATLRENRRQLLRRNHLKLRIRAVAGLLILAPSAELRRVAEPVSLHVVVSDFHHQLGAQRFPRQVLALAPAALPARHTFRRISRFAGLLCPMLPWMIVEGVFAVWL